MRDVAEPRLGKPLFVELSGSGLRHVFALEAGEERAFLVGSSRQADLCIARPGVAAVEFHVERVGDEVWLEPAYRGRGLCIDGVPVSSRRCVTGRCRVALGALELELQLFTDDSALRAPSRSSSAPRPLPTDYSRRLPTDTARTELALQPLSIEAALHTLALSPLAPQRTERLAPLAPAEVQRMESLQRTARIPAHFPAAAFETQRLPKVAAPAPAEPPLAAQETTAFDISAVAPLPPAALPATRSAPRPLGALAQLGTLTKERPWLVLGGGLLGALLLALALVGTKQLAQAPAPVTAKKASVSAPSPSVSSAPSVEPATPREAPSAVVIAVPAPSSAPRLAARAPRTPTDPELAAAVGHFAAGRLADASKSYAALGARVSAGEVYARAAALLARRGGAECGASAGAAPRGCPEVLP